MEIELHCQSCHVALKIPEAARGRRARCPNCRHVFVVPTIQEMLEDTVSGWIAHDVEEVLEGRERLVDQLEALESQLKKNMALGQGPSERRDEKRHGRRDGRSDSAGSSASKTKDAKDGSSRRSRRRSGKLWPMRDGQEKATPGGVTLSDAERPTSEAAPDKAAAAAAAAPGATEPPRKPHREKGEGEAPNVLRSTAAKANQRSRKYPTNLHVDERAPHLVVQAVGAAGVRFAFDSLWLNHEGFRASIPMRCAFSGSARRDALIARPLLFLDQSRAPQPSAEQLGQAHENRKLGERTPRQIMRAMGLIQSMPQPFANPMPCYVSNRHAHLHLHCQTRDRSSGGVTCELIVPDATTALEWLARVNGVCGKEYELLEKDVSLLHGDAWRQLPEPVRQRISVWCRLSANELVQAYFNDADFGRRDAGLAGLLVTDQRLVFCKYHHRGQVRLDEADVAVLAHAEGGMARLSLRRARERLRMITLRRQDLDSLSHVLDSQGGIEIRTETS